MHAYVVLCYGVYMRICTLSLSMFTVCLNICSESCQLLDIRSHILLSNEQNRAYSSKHIGLYENFLKEKLATREKLLMNIKLCYKRKGLKGWLFHWFVSPA